MRVPLNAVAAYQVASKHVAKLESIDRSISQSINQPTNQPVSQSIKQAINQCPNKHRHSTNMQQHYGLPVEQHGAGVQLMNLADPVGGGLHVSIALSLIA